MCVLGGMRTIFLTPDKQNDEKNALEYGLKIYYCKEKEISLYVIIKILMYFFLKIPETVFP